MTMNHLPSRISCRSSAWLLVGFVLLLADLAHGQNVTGILGLNSTNVTNSDGDLPYGQGFAPDVVVIDTSFNNQYPDNEGPTAPVLDDAPDGSVDTAPDNSTYDVGKRATKPFYLRVMPLGASITQGYDSTDGNGYRKWLREELRYQGWPVNMVGSKQDGTMRDRVSSCYVFTEDIHQT
jgi:hypothetical protein